MTASGNVVKSAAPSPAECTRGGAPLGNTNRALHGLYGVGLPSGAQRLGRRINAFRRSLCEAVEARGEIDLHAAATIDSACQWLRHGLLAARWLRLTHDELSPDQRLSFSREVAKAATERDKCIRLLRLDKAPGQIFDPGSIYLTPLPPLTQQGSDARDVETQAADDARRQGDASDAAVGDSSGDNLMPLIPAGF